MSTKVHSFLGKLKEKAKFKKPSSCEEFDETNDEEANSSVFQQNSIDAPTVIRRFEELFSELSAMTYFMRYLERNGASNLLKFWIHLEGFQSAGDCQDISKEAHLIYNTYLSPDAPQKLHLPSSILKSIDFQKLTSSNCFSKAQGYAWDQLKDVHFKGFKKSPYFIMHQVECFKTGSVELVDVLNDHRLLSPFVEFLESKNKRQLIEFILAVESFDDEVSEQTVDLQESAMVIYDKYISLQATDPLDFDSAIRIDVETKICSEDRVPQNGVFTKAKNAAQAVLETHYIPLFMKTDLYRSYVDMLGKSVQRFIQMEEERVVQEKELRVKRALSTPSRRDSNHRSKHRSTSTSSTIGDDESSSQCSDGSVSKRNPSALGRIDPLGRYESLFDTSLYHMEEPPKNGFRGVLNKYLKQSMAQEDEKSYEMARLIVEDIRNMVMNQENVQSLPSTPRKANMSG